MSSVRVILGCCIVHLTIGSIYLWGTISTYTNSYFRKQGNPDLRFTTVNSVFIATSLMIALFARVGLQLVKLFGLNRLVIFISLLNGSLVFASSFCTDFYLFFLVYGVG